MRERMTTWVVLGLAAVLTASAVLFALAQRT